MERAWYAYMGGPDADYKDVGNYFKLTVKPNCLCGVEICAIYVPDNGHQPAHPLSSNIKNYINQALLTTQMQPEKPYCAKKYIYLR